MSYPCELVLCLPLIERPMSDKPYMQQQKQRRCTQAAVCFCIAGAL